MSMVFGWISGIATFFLIVYIIAIYQDMSGKDAPWWVFMPGSLVILGVSVLVGRMTYELLESWQQAEQARNAHQQRLKELAEAEKGAEEVALRSHIQEQQRYRGQMVVLGDQTLGVFESMPGHLADAETYLDGAEFDFADRAFAPFWDWVEKAARALGHYDEGLRRIQGNASSYNTLVKEFETAPPEFPISPESVRKLSTGTATAERMKSVVRRAQRDFQFAVIYEQRKTNQILVAGFQTLGQALDRMTQQIVSSIDDLASSVGEMTSTLNQSLSSIHSRMGEMQDANVKHYGRVSAEASQRAARERKVWAMLDNIQRGRKPLDAGFRHTLDPD